MKILINGERTENFSNEKQLLKRLQELRKAHIDTYYQKFGKAYIEKRKGEVPKLKVEIFSK